MSKKRLENIADIYSNIIILIKHLTTYNLYDLQLIATNLENFHYKWTYLKTEVLRYENIFHQNIINNLPSR
ncbi:unnamed protein product [Rotaria sp. Silwood2]|nr:unnamed protein product [Rotaria sp. Silwood2]CAF4251070.1 unnamed protein product [Rotaria sp. Silwood2]CAF4855635.1 unnamed protein product [Rotaria sp. Silwood2]